MYSFYTQARDAAWKTLLDCKITSLPVDLKAIANYYDIAIELYSKCALVQTFDSQTLSGDGFIAKISGQKVIFLNDKIKTRGRRRFTLAHELGHGVMDHPLDRIIARNSEIDSSVDWHELQGNVFARDVLAPACVLNAIGVTTPAEIMKICDISRQSAEIRLQRLNLLRKRGLFFSSPLEIQVFKQFDDYVKSLEFELNLCKNDYTLKGAVAMEYIFPAIFCTNDDGSYTITYPDLPGCISEGNSIENAMYMAQSALTQWLEYLTDKKIEIPKASSMQDVDTKENEFVNLIRVEINV